MSRFVLGIAFVAMLLAPSPGRAGVASFDDASGEMVMGEEDAPVTIIEYSSLTCPHCATFHRETLPKIKQTYIDTGKAKLVYRDFPFGALALAAAMVARCAGPAKYFGMIEILFRSQDKWSLSRNPLVEIKRVARFGGISAAGVDECLDNEPLMKSIQQGKAAAIKQFDVNSTPTFFIGETRIDGAQPYGEFEAAIEKALKEKN